MNEKGNEEEMEPPPKRRQYNPPTTLTDDLIISEILTRLPPDSIARFRCASKHWLSRTTHPHFLRLHAAAASSSPSGFFLFPSACHTAEYFPLHPPSSGSHLPDPFLSSLNFDGRPPHFADSRCGLILLRQPLRFPSPLRDPPSLCVCNPTTHSCRFVPVPEAFATQEIHLFFDPSISPHFKIAAILVGHLFVYSSETCQWKVVVDNLRAAGYGDVCFWLKSVQWNGALIWSGPKNTLVSFDARTERLRKLSQPEFELEHWCRYLGESRGCLYYIGKPVPATDESVVNFDIWEMNPGGSSGWVVSHRIDIGHIKNVYPEVNMRVKSCLAVEVVCFLRGGEGGQGDRLLLSIPGKIVSYHVRHRTFTTICENLPIRRRFPVHSWEWFNIHAPTLFTFDGNNDVDNPFQDWIYWTNACDQQLLALMVKHSLNGRRCGSGFKMCAWRDMMVKLNAIPKLKNDSTHLNNRLLSYRREFRIVNKILSCEGFSWDPTLQMVIAGDSKWRDLVKKNINAAMYRRRKVPFKDLEIICAPLFPSCHMSLSCKIDNALTTVRYNYEKDISSESAREAPNESGGTSAARKIAANCWKQTMMSPTAENKTTMLLDDCLEELDVMKEIDNELYVKALLILKDEFNQMVFLKTKGVRRLMWLKAVTQNVNLS